MEEPLTLIVKRGEMAQFTGSLNNFDIAAMEEMLKGKHPALHQAWLGGADMSVSILPHNPIVDDIDQLVKITAHE